uniref:Transposase n=1 Tax=Globodera rostochiensis TaxID=31243 RepID=A0A914IEX7_GLORO
MEEFWILILVSFFVTNSLDKAKSVQLFDEIFGEGWWDNEKDEEWNKLTFEQNLHHQIDRQNTKIGQIEPNSTDQNPPLTESDHSKQIDEIFGEGWWDNEKDEEWNKLTLEQNFHHQIGRQNTPHLGQIEPYSTDQNTPLTESDHCRQEENIAENEQKHKTVAKELGLSYTTIYKWKRELGQTAPNKHSYSEQKELMKRYYAIKGKNSKIKDVDIAKMLKIGKVTLYKWKKLFKQQQFYPNSVDGHAVEVNAGSTIQEIENSDSGSI